MSCLEYFLFFRDRMQEVRSKDQDQVSRKDKAELEAARSRLKFLSIELDALKHKMKETKSPRNNNVLSGSGKVLAAVLVNKQPSASWYNKLLDLLCTMNKPQKLLLCCL